MGQKVWETFTNQKQWESYLKNLVKTNDRALIKAIVLIYDLQTEEEKNTGQSVEENKIGFSKIDAYELGNIAKKIKRGQSLTEAEVAKSRNKMQKYWKQLMTISKKQMQEKKDQEAKEELKQLEEEMYYEQLTFEDVFPTQEKTCPCCYGICDECEGVQMQLELEESHE
ncbi:MAG: hypothetical protein PHN69_05385 [Candidatus Pacebacteria bacterium]|nr:hypothetical protein [Candidatus Paceibacterota bacterium]